MEVVRTTNYECFVKISYASYLFIGVKGACAIADMLLRLTIIGNAFGKVFESLFVV